MLVGMNPARETLTNYEIAVYSDLSPTKEIFAGARYAYNINYLTYYGLHGKREEENFRRDKKFTFANRWIAIMMIITFTASAVFLPSLIAEERMRIPFIGMSLVYYGVDWNGETEIRTVSVLRYDKETNQLVVRDSQDTIDIAWINPDTREIVKYTGGWSPEPIYVEYWIPTDISVGPHVSILQYDAVVVGSTRMCVDGRPVYVWKLQANGIDEYGNHWQGTWYYEVKT